MEDGPVLTLAAGGRSLRILPRRRLRPRARDYWDGNWLVCRVEADTGAFRAGFEGEFRADEFSSFLDQLHVLHGGLSSEAKLETMERCVSIRVKGDGRGNFAAACGLSDDAATGGRLEFTIDFDRTLVPAMLESLAEILRAFPVVGHP